MLIISDYIWSDVSKGNMELIEKARNGGMKFYGLGVNTLQHQLDMLEDADKHDDETLDGYSFLKQCDSTCMKMVQLLNTLKDR